MTKKILIITTAFIVLLIAVGATAYITLREALPQGRMGQEGEEVKEQSVATTSEEGVAQPEQKQRRISFIRPAVETVPQEVREWVKNFLKLDMTRFGNTEEFDGKQYLFVSSGRKPTSGYLVEIFDIVVVGQKEVAVKGRFANPPEGHPVSQIITYPYDLVYIEATGLPARFIPTGDDEYIPITFLVGIDHLLPVVAQSRGIKLFTPAPDKVVKHKFSVSGVANVFEANVLYRLFDIERKSLLEGFITAATAGNWGYFIIHLTVPDIVESGASLTLELYTMDAKSGREANLVVIPLKIE